ncbi:serine carboxypeptidase S10 family protein [Striga asiatica]|uniref:Serine carboxypeptidase S10 family protein n=1 Tax=Striga asiatica TaxID=4170 RepID=A0A5A7RKF4_STRAF|nr:serine carboxypeptidase S10 family protein [Striga asiatica]
MRFGPNMTTTNQKGLERKKKNLSSPHFSLPCFYMTNFTTPISTGIIRLSFKKNKNEKEPITSHERTIQKPMPSRRGKGPARIKFWPISIPTHSLPCETQQSLVVWLNPSSKSSKLV